MPPRPSIAPSRDGSNLSPVGAHPGNLRLVRPNSTRWNRRTTERGNRGFAATFARWFVVPLAWGLRLVVALLAGFVPGSARGAEPEERPNIVFILADDLGWTDLGVQGSRYYETPAIDRLAAQGVRFLRHHTSPNCQPTRAALLTGQYGPRTGVYTVGSIDRFAWWRRSLRPVDNVTALPLDKITIAEALRDAGYATALFGKWHLGDNGPHHPSQRGFQEALVTAGRHFNFQTKPRSTVPPGQYLADFLTDHAVDFIERNRSRPFFLYLPHFGVHSPHQAKTNWIEHFQRKPGVNGHSNAVYAAMIASVDESVGRVLATLDRLDLSRRTIVIFSSDNGGVGGYRREGLPKSDEPTDNAPLRSGKGSLYEGGTRVPFIVRWPGVTPPGTTSSNATIHVDLFPTLLEIARAKVPTRKATPTAATSANASASPTGDGSAVALAAAPVLDGESLVPLFRDPAARLRREAIFHHFPGYLGAGRDAWRTTPAGAIEADGWKLIEFFEEGRLELYHLDRDPGEQHNLATRHPEKARELHAKLRAWRTAIRAPMPTPHTAGVRPPGQPPEEDP